MQVGLINRGDCQTQDQQWTEAESFTLEGFNNSWFVQRTEEEDPLAVSLKTCLPRN